MAHNKLTSAMRSARSRSKPHSANRCYASQLNADGPTSAKDAGLCYVSDLRRCFRRVRAAKGFAYLDTHGRLLKNRRQLARIKALVIPPAWEDVQICPQENGHLQATGRDSRGRKQYRYHPRWKMIRDATKFDRMLAFANALPRLRRQVKKDLAGHGLSREKVLATVIRLMEITLIRVGNEEYARQNNSFGLTTLRTNHVDISGSHLRFEFRGKSGVTHAIDVRDPRLSRIVRRCQELPGQPLFQYLDGQGHRHDVTSADINDYLRNTMGQDFTSKDFRTWAGTVLAATALHQLGPFRSATQAKRNLARAIESVAKRLGNTKAVCRKCYVHPAVQTAYLENSLEAVFQSRVRLKRPLLSADETTVLTLFQRRSRHRRIPAGA